MVYIMAWRLNMAKSMTEGKPLKLILQFALPLLMGNIFQQTYNIVDAAIVGNYLGTKALASVGASASVQFLVMGFCIGICCGFGIPVAQRFGAKDYNSMRSCIFHAEHAVSYSSSYTYRDLCIALSINFTYTVYTR